MKRSPIWQGMAIALLSIVSLSGCNGVLDANMATLNAAATNAASGQINVTLPAIPGAELLTPQPTNPPNTYDLTIDPNGNLATAWGSIYAQGGGTQFTLIATELQAGQFVIQTVQAAGWQESVRGGSVAIGLGQTRVDLAILLELLEQFGAGTVTFQPTLDGTGALRLNPLGADFGTLTVPSGLTSSIGDAVHSLLTGAATDNQSRVNLTQITLQGGIMQVSGTVR
jgi:hypothetical protein